MFELPKTQARYLHAISLQKGAASIAARRVTLSKPILERMNDEIETLLDECLVADPYRERTRPLHAAVMFVRHCVFRNRDFLERDALVPVVETLVKATGRLRDVAAHYEFMVKVPKADVSSNPPLGQPVVISMPDRLTPSVRTRIEEMAATFSAIIHRMAAENQAQPAEPDADDIAKA